MHELVPERVARRARSRSTASTSTAPTLLVTEIRRRIGMVFQKPNPFPAMTVAENVVAGLKLGGHRLVAQRDAARLVEELPRSAPGSGTR